MAEEVKKAQEETEEQEQETKEAPEKGKKGKKKQQDSITDDVVREMSHGKLILGEPFTADDVEITELHFDFMNLTGIEMMDAIDRGATDKGSAFRISNRQALELFIASAAKETEGVDAGDIRRGLSPMDSVKAVQLATVFFVTSSQAGNSRIKR